MVLVNSSESDIESVISNPEIACLHVMCGTEHSGTSSTVTASPNNFSTSLTVGVADSLSNMIDATADSHQQTESLAVSSTLDENIVCDTLAENVVSGTFGESIDGLHESLSEMFPQYSPSHIRDALANSKQQSGDSSKFNYFQSGSVNYNA